MAIGINAQPFVELLDDHEADQLCVTESFAGRREIKAGRSRRSFYPSRLRSTVG
jgi:hypothetical protein